MLREDCNRCGEADVVILSRTAKFSQHNKAGSCHNKRSYRLIPILCMSESAQLHNLQRTCPCLQAFLGDAYDRKWF
uniref:Bm463, isoform a n=1 Tax=Brugia malayi TaxID=6279 RepID=A0A0J9XUV1_BRUMA|nr:Bm463, isoform a [Brugia malayi]